MKYTQTIVGDGFGEPSGPMIEVVDGVICAVRTFRKPNHPSDTYRKIAKEIAESARKTKEEIRAINARRGFLGFTTSV